MKLLVILLCLLSERFLIHSASYNRFTWFEHYFLYIDRLFIKYNIAHNPLLILILLSVPITVIIGLFYWLLSSILFGFLGFIVNLIVFYYCLGPQNPFYPTIESTSTETSIASGIYLAQVNNQLFAVLFWYIIGGPIAALLFRLISLSQNISYTALLAKDITEVLEWLPARMTVLLYLLVGNFQVGVKRFIDFLWAKPGLNNEMLNECGLLAAGINDVNEVSMPMAETLVEHAVIVLLVLIALFTLVAWL